MSERDDEEDRDASEVDRQLGRLMRQTAGPPADWFGPRGQAIRWLDLQEHQRNFLAGKSKTEIDRIDALIKLDAAKLEALVRLSSEDIDDVKDAINFARSIRTVGIFARWTVITIFAAVLGVLTLGEKIATLWKGMTGR